MQGLENKGDPEENPRLRVGIRVILHSDSVSNHIDTGESLRIRGRGAFRNDVSYASQHSRRFHDGIRLAVSV